MLFGRTSGVAVLAGAMAVGLLAWVPSAQSGSPAPGEGEAEFLPIQNISYAFGSKSMSGYFLQRSSACLVTLMIVERSDPDGPLSPSSPARIRLLLNPGQVAGLDSEEGRSLNLTCGEDGATLRVAAGERDQLVEAQDRALHENLAQKR
jgi:hypothetical protein